MTNTLFSFSSRTQAVITAVFAMFVLVTSLLAPIAEVYATTSPYDWGPDWYYVEEPYSYTTDTYTYTYYDYSYPSNGYDNSGYGSYYYDDYSYSYDDNYSYYDSTTYTYTETTYDYDYEYNTCAQTACGCGGCPSTSAPEVTTKSATNIDEDSATLRCSLDDTGDLATDVWFEYGTSQYNLSRSTSHDTYSSSRTVEKSVTGLSDDTTYYYRCVGENSKGTDTGSVMSFKTGEGEEAVEAPEVETKSATNIDEDSATLRCYVNPNDSDTDVWFEYGETTSMNDDTSKQEYDDVRTVERSVTGLDPDTKYYFRCVAENDEGKVYGDRLYFTTEEGEEDELPFVSTNQPTNVSASSATLNGYVNPRGDSDTERWFEYGPTLSLGYSTSRYRQGSSAGNFNDYVSSLNDNTTYYYRSVARNDAGTNYGNIVSFRTGMGGWTNQAPVATTGNATNIGRSSARFTGNVSVPTSAYTTAWFEWGTTQSLGRSTSAQAVSGSSMFTEHSQFGLEYDTTYYYRLVVQNTYGVSRGHIVSFTTLGAPNGGTTTYVQYVAPVTKEYGARVTKTVENLDAPNGSSTEVFAEQGQALRFAIRVENTGDYTLEDVTIRDLVPHYLEFANAEETLRYDGTRREVVWYVGELREGESREVTLDMVVTDDARLGSTIENIARLESDKHEEVSNSIFIRVTDDVLADAKANRNAGAAAAFLGWNGIFPDTLLGWLIFTILLLIIIVLIRQLVLFYNEHKAKRAMRYVPQAPVAPVAYQGGTAPYAPAPATLPVAPVAYPTAPNTPQGTPTVFPMGPAGQQ